MEESMTCECGNNEFWYFWEFVRCPKCWNEYKRTTIGRKKLVEQWVRRFNKEENHYPENWEHVSREQLRGLK